MKLRLATVAFVLVGVVAASTVSDRGAFVMGFFVLMFGGIAAALVLVPGRRSKGDQAEPISAASIESPDPFTDEHGIVRYPGDEFDLENHPLPGAHGRI